MLPIESSWGDIPDSTLISIGDQAVPHILWRSAFFKAVGEKPSSNTLLSKAHTLATTIQGAKKDKNVLKNILKKTQKKSSKPRKRILNKKKEKKEKEINKKGKGKTGTTGKKRRNSVLKKAVNKKAKTSSATAGSDEKGRKGKRGKILNGEKSKSAKNEEL